MPDLIAPSGIAWHYEVEGQGEDLVFFHGWGANLRIWRQQVKYFSQFYRVCSMDLPGHGKSSWHSISLEEMAKDAGWLLERIGVQGMTAVASSFGGLVALKVSGQNPGRIRRMVLVGSQPKFQRSEDYPFGLEAERIKKLAEQLQSDYPSMVHIFFRSLFTPQERRTRRYRWIQTFRQAEDVPEKEALLWALDLLASGDLRSELFSLDVPLQFINGTEDYICPSEMFEYFRRKLPRARFDWFEKCGHYPFLCDPYGFNRVVESFLKTPTHHKVNTHAS